MLHLGDLSHHKLLFMYSLEKIGITVAARFVGSFNEIKSVGMYWIAT